MRRRAQKGAHKCSRTLAEWRVVNVEFFRVGQKYAFLIFVHRTRINARNTRDRFRRKCFAVVRSLTASDRFVYRLAVVIFIFRQHSRVPRSS